MKQDRALEMASRLKIVMNMPEYQDTFGAWLDEAYQTALHQLTSAVEPHDVHRAQGAYKALSTFKELITRTLDMEKAAVDKKDRKILKTK